ncbi:MAG: TrmH family RNA methyltransferase [Oscillospiraceae bacterium]|jgi:tRNA G18 (ribose-2'-O)-methylase SpoU
MPNRIEITDLTRPELDVFARLTEAQLRSRREAEKGIFIAESPKVIERALDAGCEPVSLLMERRQIEGQAAGILARCGDVPVYTADRELLAGLTGYSLTRGVLCAMRRPRLPSVEELCAGARRVAVLENIVDTTNVGAIFRSAAALGMDGVLVTPSCCDPLYRRAVRVSMGTVFQIPWTRIGIQPADWPGAGMERLRSLGFRTAAMALSGTAVSVDDPRLAAEEKLAIVLGTEGDGLTRSTIADCDYTVCIPMLHGVDSLNVAAASAVAFWQLRARG